MTQMWRLLAIALVLTLGAGIAACGSDSDSDQGSAADNPNAARLESAQWKLMNIASNQGWATSLPNTIDPPTIGFEGGKVSLFAGCGSGSAEVDITADTIDLGAIELDGDSCDESAEQIQFLVTEVTDGQVDYSFDDGSLIIARDGSSLIFTKASQAG